MGKLESLVVSSFIAVLVPVCLFFAAWWLSVGIVPERWIFVCAVAGLGLGILLDCFFLKTWAARAYRMSVTRLVLLYLFVSIVTYGVCMGVPVLILVPGTIAGLYTGRRLRHSAGEEKGAAASARAARGTRAVALFTASVIACAAGLSAFLALRERTIELELQHMFHLRWVVTRPMIVALVAFGIPALALAQYWCTAKAAHIAYGAHEYAA
jgi:hypothetical protein